MIPITLDFETYYAADYSLTKLTTEEYIRSPLFETIGVAIKVGDGPINWYPKDEVEAALRAIDWSDKLLIAQNTQFDGAILAWRFGIVPYAYGDTLGMSRALYPHDKSHSLESQSKRLAIGEKGDEVVHALGKRYADFTPEALAKYGSYCCNDVALTYTLFNHYMRMGFPLKELRLIDLTLRLFIEPRLVLDAKLVAEHLETVMDTRESLLAQVRDLMLEGADSDFVHAVYTEGMDGVKKLLMSNDKLADVLIKLGVPPPTKVSARTGKEAYAFAKTDQEFVALQEHEDPLVQAVVSARLGVKSTIEETRSRRFLAMAARGEFPIPLRYYGAHSGRWSGQDKINLQNLASRGVYGGKLKKAIKAPPGYVIIDCDSSQIEARTVAWLAGQEDLVGAFRAKQDVYKIMASAIYNVPISDITPTQRQVGKTVVLGAGFGVGHAKLRVFLKTTAKVDVDEAEAKRIVDTYRDTYAQIPKLWRSAQTALEALHKGTSHSIDVHGMCRTTERGITLPNGLFIQYPGLTPTQTEKGTQWTYQSKGESVKVYGGLTTENITQAVARCVVAEQMLRIAKRYKVVLMVHDAVACIAPEAEKDEARAFVEECMSWVPPWAPGLPLACESGVGYSYGDC